jgi:hypothetical protein
LIPIAAASAPGLPALDVRLSPFTRPATPVAPPCQLITGPHQAARSRFGIEEAILIFFRPYLYLDRERSQEAGSEPEEAEQALATAPTDVAGITLAVARSVLRSLQNFRRNRSSGS